MTTYGKFALLLGSFIVLRGDDTQAFHDRSRHTVKFVTVDEHVELEVLDWGGSGRPVVLLAGSGNSAHIFDGFADKLAEEFHVYGITRRGYGASSLPASGYGAQRRGDDVVRVLDSLSLTKPVVVGHSLGGTELTALASAYPDRVSGLVYIDSSADPTFDWSPYEALRRKLPASVNLPRPAWTDFETFQAYQAWQKRTVGYSFPESELRSVYFTLKDGSMGPHMTPPRVTEAITAGMGKPDFSRIRVPVLAFYALPESLDKQIRRYLPQTPAEREALEQVYAFDVGYSRRISGSLRDAVPAAKIVEIPGANHYMFLSNEEEVLRELRGFVRQLNSSASSSAPVVNKSR
jgi:pimeloyl-ACP methyl ester carboxylesterase